MRRVAELEQENRYLRSQLSADVGERCDARLAMLERARRAEGEVARLRAQLPAQVGLAAAAVDELARLRAVLAEPSLEERRRLARVFCSAYLGREDLSERSVASALTILLAELRRLAGGPHGA